MYVVITGPGRLGLIIADALAHAGHTPVLLAHSPLPACPYPTIACDLTLSDEIPALVDKLLTCIPTIDALIQCASRFEVAPPFEAYTEHYERLWRLNTLAPILLAQAVHARQAKCHMIHFLDQRIDALDASGSLPYTLTKKSLRDFTLAAAKAWAPARVNAIAPGAVLPPPTPGHSEKAGCFLVARPTPQDIASAVRFLLETPTITGQILYIDGGQHLL